MGRAIVFVAVLVGSAFAAPDESVVAKLLPNSDVVTELSIGGGGSVVRRIWDGPGILVIATKHAPTRATLDALRVSYSVDETNRASLQVGEHVAGRLRPLPAGTSVDLTVYLPSRLVPAWQRHRTVEPDPTSAALAAGTIEPHSP